MTKQEIATQVVPVGARRFNTADLSSPNPRPNLMFNYKGYPHPPKGWRCSEERMAELDRKGLLLFPESPDGRIMFKRHLDEQKGPMLGNVFCGCGTALVAAQNLKRQWIGIDISPTACRVMAKRLRKDCGLAEDEKLWNIGRGFVVRDLPWSEEKLRKIPPFEFENWAVIALGGIPNKAQVGDMGIDGRIFPISAAPKKASEVRDGETGGLGFMDDWYPIQVKQKDKASRPDIDSFEAAMTREDRKKGFFVAFDYSSDALREVDGFFRRSGKIIIPLTVKEIIEETLAKKLA